MDQQEQNNQELVNLKARLFDVQEENKQLNQIVGHIAQQLGVQDINDLLSKVGKASELLKEAETPKQEVEEGPIAE